MTIEILDWIMYFFLLFVVYKVMPEDFKFEMGILAGCFVMVVYTIIYCIVFWFFSWSDIFNAIGNYFQNMHFKW